MRKLTDMERCLLLKLLTDYLIEYGSRDLPYNERTCIVSILEKMGAHEELINYVRGFLF